LEEGRVTDSLGRVVDFRDTVVVMTSNVGAATAGEAGSLGFETGVSSDEAYAHRATKAAYQAAMSDQFRPEFLNRLDDIIVFRPLEREDLRQVVHLELAGRVKGTSYQITGYGQRIMAILDQIFDAARHVPVLGSSRDPSTDPIQDCPASG
jgi:ATP-dependent Clp protease ATP-binding subunit ClpC